MSDAAGPPAPVGPGGPVPGPDVGGPSPRTISQPQPALLGPQPYPGAPSAPLPLAAPTKPGRVERAMARFWSGHAESGLSAWTIGGVVAAGALVALLVVGHRPGLGLALAVPVLWAPAVPMLVRRRAWSRLATAGLAVLLGAMAAVRDADWVVALCLLAACGLTAVAASAARSPLGLVAALPTVPAAAARGTRWMLTQLASRRSQGSVGAMRGVRTAVLTLGILVVFGTLLGSADAVFASVLPSLDLRLVPAQVALGIVATLTAIAIVSLTVQRPGWSVTRARRAAAQRPVEWAVPVLALGALMLGFLVIQLLTAVGGDDYVSATAGLTYAAYARQGFGQLVAVTALTLLLVAWFARRVPRTGEHAPTWPARLALGWLCLAALGIVATAMMRLSLYVQAYGLTELRLMAAAGEVVMGVALLLVLVAGVRWRARWLPLAVVRLAGVAMLGLALLNPDALMVRYNTSSQEVPVDVWHLSRLSADAVPAIDQLPEPLRTCLLSRQDPAVDPSVWGWNHARSVAAAIDDVPSDLGSCSQVD